MSGFEKAKMFGCLRAPVTRLPRVLFNQRGTALVLSLVMLTILSLLGALALNTSDTELGISANHRANVETFCAAERAVEYARSIVAAGSVSSSGYTLNDTEATNVEAGLTHGSLQTANISDLDYGDNHPCPPGTGSEDPVCKYFRIEVTTSGAKDAESQLEVQVAEEIMVGSSNIFDL